MSGAVWIIVKPDDWFSVVGLASIMSFHQNYLESRYFILSLFFTDGKLKLGEAVQGFHRQEVVELHLSRTKAHVHNHCTTLRFLSHEVGAKYFLEGYGNPGWGQNM